jgi:hypothetical protein
MKKVVLCIVGVIVVVAVGFFGYRYYKISSTLGAIAPLVTNVSLRVSNDVRYEYDESSNITYEELSKKNENDLAEIDNKIIDIQSLPTTFCKDKVSTAVIYVQSCQELLRALLNKHRRELDVKVAVKGRKESFLQSLKDMFGKYSDRRADKDLEDQKEKKQELRDSIQEVLSVIGKLERDRKEAIKILPAKTLIDASVLDKLNKKIDEQSKYYASLS